MGSVRDHSSQRTPRSQGVEKEVNLINKLLERPLASMLVISALGAAIEGVINAVRNK